MYRGISVDDGEKFFIKKNMENLQGQQAIEFETLVASYRNRFLESTGRVFVYCWKIRLRKNSDAGMKEKAMPLKG